MLQIDHVYEFLFQEIFKDFEIHYPKNGVVDAAARRSADNIVVFKPNEPSTKKIFLYDQEPLLPGISEIYFDVFNWPEGYDFSDIKQMNQIGEFPFGHTPVSSDTVDFFENNPSYFYKKHKILVSSEHSSAVKYFTEKYKLLDFYYFFHGFAALDWYRGYYALNYSKSANRNYKYDYVSYNRIINNDRSYRIYWVSKLLELDLLKHGQVSFNVTDNLFDDWCDEVASPDTKLSDHARQHAEQHLTSVSKLVVDSPTLPGSASADIPRTTDAFWNIVTETVFYYDKLHLTEKIFKPIVSKQPFMLLAAPGNLAYLKSYGFKTFDSVIDESYDLIQDNDSRIDAVAEQLRWYCNLPAEEKQKIIEHLAPIVEYNFQHFYGEFKHIITRELLDNIKVLFGKLNYDDSTVNYDLIYRVLTK